MAVQFTKAANSPKGATWTTGMQAFLKSWCCTKGQLLVLAALGLIIILKLAVVHGPDDAVFDSIESNPIPNNNASVQTVHTTLSQREWIAAAATQLQEEVSVSGKGFTESFQNKCEYRPPTHAAWPKLIHQTVKNKLQMSCLEVSLLSSWSRVNPEYKQVIYDDKDIATFMQLYAPAYLDTYNKLETVVEKTDLWRYLVVHVFGGVYADADSACKQPIRLWNCEHSFDANVLLGIEAVIPSQDVYRTVMSGTFNVVQFFMVSAPGHPMSRHFADLVKRNVELEHSGARLRVLGDRGVINRTGPGVVSKVTLQLMAQHNITQDEASNGTWINGVRVLPVNAFATGMGYAGSKGGDNEETLARHLFRGSWKQGADKKVDAFAWDTGCRQMFTLETVNDTAQWMRDMLQQSVEVQEGLRVVKHLHDAHADGETIQHL